MNEDDVIRFVRAYIEGLFPKVCTKCGTRFESLHEYLKLTTHIGAPIFYDTVGGKPIAEPMGPMSYANCRCGTTLTIDSEGIPPAQMAALLEWAREESSKRSITIRALLTHIRGRIDAEVFRDAEERGNRGNGPA
jgi:hypothetical protein